MVRKDKINNDLCIVDPIWESLDPIPDVRILFDSFNKQFFKGKLDSVEVRWSTRMTLCAGTCYFEGKGGLCSISLSEPLLKFRSRKELIETLLNRDGHGPNFIYHMNRINKLADTNITVYHTFFEEVDSYRKHWWRCNGPCSKRPPHYGYVKRSMNRAPGIRDFWWADHRANCTGRFIKIRSPEKKVSTKRNVPNKDRKGCRDITNFFHVSTNQSNAIQSVNSQPVPSTSMDLNYSFSCSSPVHDIAPYLSPVKTLKPTNKPSKVNEPQYLPEELVICPCCLSEVAADIINLHLDYCAL